MSGELACYINLGVYFKLGTFTKAVEYHGKALVIKTETGDKVGESNCYTGLGNAYFYLGAFTKAIEYLQKALNIASAIGDIYNEAIVHKNLGIIYNEQEPEIAYNHSKRSIELTEVR